MQVCRSVFRNTQIEVLGLALKAHAERGRKTHNLMGMKALGVGDGEFGAPVCLLKIAHHIQVADKTEISLL